MDFDHVKKSLKVDDEGEKFCFFLSSLPSAYASLYLVSLFVCCQN